MNRQFCVFIFDMAVVVAMKKISNDPWSAKEIYDHMNSSQRNQRGLQQSNVCGDTATGVCVRHGLMNSNFLHIAAYTPVLDLEFRFGVSTQYTRNSSNIE